MRCYLNSYGYGYDLPFIRKAIEEVKIRGKKPYSTTLHYILTKKDNTYKFYSINAKRTSANTLYVITLNDKIIYWCHSNILMPANAAWHILTEVYHGYKPHTASWQLQSNINFDCIDCFLTKAINNDIYFKEYITTSWSAYQKEMHNATGNYYIDKKLISAESAANYAEKKYFHI